MERYTLTQGGRARFHRTKIRADIEEIDKMVGYKLLDCLYTRGASNIDEIMAYSGRTYEQVVHDIESLMPWGYIEEYEGR